MNGDSARVTPMSESQGARESRFGRWINLAAELALVVVGILLAFQLDRAYQASQDRQLEQRYLRRLAEDLRRDSASIAANIERTGTRMGQVGLLQASLRDPTVAAADPPAFALALEQVTWRSVASISTGTFDELQSTGRSILLRSEALRGELARYYSFIEEQRRLGLGEDDQDRFRIATLGLLSGSQLSAIEEPGRYPLEVSAAEATAIARAFGSRRDAYLWLGRLVKYQVLMQRISRDFHTRNQRLLAQVDSLITGDR